MKKLLFVLILFALIAVFPSVCVAGGISDPQVSMYMNYWLADVSYHEEEADQNYFPSLTVLIKFDETWSAIAEYSDGDSNTTEEGTVIESKRYLVGVQYNFEEGYYVTCSFQKTDFNMATEGEPWGVDHSGLRIGGGYNFVEFDEPWTGSFDFGYGITNNATVNLTGDPEKHDADEVDADLKFIYSFNKFGLKGVVGYRYIRTRANLLESSYTHIVEGPYIGFGRVW